MAVLLHIRVFIGLVDFVNKKIGKGAQEIAAAKLQNGLW